MDLEPRDVLQSIKEALYVEGAVVLAILFIVGVLVTR
jgi:hypothetical protein